MATDKWYMHKPESVAGNAKHIILKDFVIQTDHLIPARRKTDRQLTSTK